MSIYGSTSSSILDQVRRRNVLIVIIFWGGLWPLFAQTTNNAPVKPAPPATIDTNEPGVLVSRKIDLGYTVTNAQTATRTDTPIGETPLGIQVVPNQVIKDQNVVRLKDVSRNVSSVAPMKTEGNGIQFETAYIRGFSQLLSIDSVNLYTMPTVDLIGVEQVEVLKGPSSSLYGAVEPGGLINVIPKLPQLTPYSEFAVEFGSYNFYRAEMDSTGAINQDMAYRVEAAYQNNFSFRDFLHQRSEFFGPSLTYNLSQDTRLTFWTWYQHLERPQDNGVVFSYTGTPVGPISRNLAGPAHNSQQIDDLIHGIDFEHDVSSDLKLRAKFLMHYFDGKDDAIRWSTVSAANTIAPYYDASSFHNWQFDLLTDALWKFDLGPTKHQILIGTELSRNDYFYDRLVDMKLPVINIFDPVYPSGNYDPIPGVAEQHTLTQGVAGYLQDQMDALDDRLHFLLGGRIDYVNQYYLSWSNGMVYKQEDTGPNGRAGLLYDLTPWVSPYVNICRSFNPNTAGSNLTYSGGPLQPTTGLQEEAGLKFSFLDKRLTMTTAAYEITKDHVAIADVAHPGFSLDGGTMRSQGVELDLSGQLTPELQVIGNYAYCDTTVVKSTSLPVGASFLNIPENSGSLWLNYTFQNGALKNFGLGAGVFARDREAGDSKDSFYLPGFARVDAGAWYTFNLPTGQEVHVQVNIFNLLDKTYYESSSSAGSVEPGTPLSVLGRCSLIF
ncbi:MAG: TonB-dependent siderophore receptor [Methylacidiphilales bacterium]|nr:TonB-dependent siderophore receptor [Candidatus Methylacidiphilales bacterium]